MRKRLTIGVGTLLCVLIIAWYFGADKKDGVNHRADAEGDTKKRASGEQKPEASPQGRSEKTLQKNKFPEEGLDTLNHREIRFFGRVVDQNGAPVPGATVYVTVLYRSALGAGQERNIIKTEGDGSFTVSGYKGRTLDIGLSKEGYDYEGDTGPFHYTLLVGKDARFEPDEKNPVKFVMWKRKGAEPMVRYYTVDVELSFDGTPQRVDLLKGRVVKEGGDIVIRAGVPPGGTAMAPNGRWDWDLIFEAVDGGFVRSNRKLMSEAPAEGYLPSMNLGQRKEDKGWWGQAKGDFYIFSRGKLYSKVHLYFTGNPHSKWGRVTLDWQTNPSGSRNLEYDKAKDVTDRYREK
jgi:hypothetical protein